MLGDIGGANNLDNNPHTLTPSRHNDVRHRFLRELAVDGTADVKDVENRNKQADLLMKPLATQISRLRHSFLSS